MRVLTGEEVRELEFGLTSESVEYDYNYALVLNMGKAGLLSVRHLDALLEVETTVRGQLALRCHRAFLASKGAST